MSTYYPTARTCACIHIFRLKIPMCIFQYFFFKQLFCTFYKCFYFFNINIPIKKIFASNYLENVYCLSFSPLTLWSQITKNIISKSVIYLSATLENKHRKHSEKPIQNFTVQSAFSTCFTNVNQKSKLNAQPCQLLRKYVLILLY